MALRSGADWARSDANQRSLITLTGVSSGTGAVEPSKDDGSSMSGFETLMWELERDPQLGSTFANLSIFDRPPDRERLRHRMAGAVQAVPRLRQRVAESRNPFDRPKWVHDEHFELDHHLRWVNLGGTGSIEELYELAAGLSRVPFDRQRPLWEFVTIEGLADGRAAMLQRLHHTITDGKGGIRLSLQFVDLERDPPLRLIEGGGGDEIDASIDSDDGADPASGDSCNGVIDNIAGAVTGAASGAARTVSGAVEAVASSPAKIGDLGSLARSTWRQAMVGRRKSPLWTNRSLDRWFGTTAVSLQDVRDAAHELGGSVNDFFVAGAATASARYHLHFDAAVDELRVSMPVSTRHDRSAGGNAFSPTQVLVSTDLGLTATERFELIKASLTAAKGERVVSAMEHAADAAAAMPSLAIIRAGQHLTRSVDFVCSNVRAAPFDLFIAGAHMEANYPLGPLAGTAVNVTTMSYRGWLFIGVVADPAAVDEPELFLELLEASYAELFALGRVPSPQRWSDEVGPVPPGA